MKKILFLVTQSEFGGAQRYIYEMATNLNKDKYDILVAAGEGDGELFRKLQNSKIQPIYLKWMKRSPWPWHVILAILEILNILKKEKPTTLFLCSTTAGFIGSLASFFYKQKIKTIYRIGGWAFRDPRFWLLNQIILILEKITARWKDKIIVNSEVDRQLALKHKIAPSEKIIKIYNGIELESLNFLSKEKARDYFASKTGFNEQKLNFLVGTVANFYKTKGLPFLIESVNMLSMPNAKYVIIGEGRQRSMLEGLIKKYNLKDKVFLVGRLPNAFQYLKAFDVFVLPSLKEGFPWIILEAMAAETSVLATKVGALSEIITDGKEGILIEPQNSKALTEKISWVLNHPLEKEKMASLAKAKVKNHFSLEKMVKETEKLLR